MDSRGLDLKTKGGVDELINYGGILGFQSQRRMGTKRFHPGREDTTVLVNLFIEWCLVEC